VRLAYPDPPGARRQQDEGPVAIGLASDEGLQEGHRPKQRAVVAGGEVGRRHGLQVGGAQERASRDAVDLVVGPNADVETLSPVGLSQRLTPTLRAEPSDRSKVLSTVPVPYVGSPTIVARPLSRRATARISALLAVA
jgi:hypothetical protein